MRNKNSIMTIDEREPNKYWKNEAGEYHRLDGPAVEIGEYKAWYQNGKRHRIDGPALYDGIDGIERHFFYLRGKYFKEKEAFFEALTPEEKEIAIFSEDFLNA